MWTLLYKSFVIFCCLALGLALARVLIIVVVVLVNREWEGQVLIDPSELAKIQIGDVAPPEPTSEAAGGNVFALVFVNGDKVSVQRLSDRRLYIAAWHEGAGRIAKRLGCASVDRVLVTKVTDPLWPTLIFGEER